MDDLLLCYSHFLLTRQARSHAGKPEGGVGKPEARLRLYIGGTVKAKLDCTLLPPPIRGKRVGRKGAASSLASTLPPT